MYLNRKQIGFDFFKKEGKIFCIDYVIYKWPEHDENSLSKNRFFKRITITETIPLDQRKFKMRIAGGIFAYYKEVIPFHLAMDECGTWLKWDKFPNPNSAEIKALTLIDPKVDPIDPSLKRGISQFLHVDAMGNLWNHYIALLKGGASPDADGVLVEMSDCRNFLGSLLGDAGSTVI